ncbi:ubiquinol-cytochrome C chaperone-domain-containing protein [Morchella snyderi]|nr:ubiquinol-cytochrome C chaperone-domain-containing protein [Morchella snyderi]
MASQNCLRMLARSAPRALTKPTPLTLRTPLPLTLTLAPALRRTNTTTAAAAPAIPSKQLNTAEDPQAANPPQPGAAAGLVSRMTESVRTLMPSTTETYVAYGVTQELYNECVAQGAYLAGGEDLSPSARFWYETCGRKPTFVAWAQVTVLHMWMLVVRFRAFEQPESVQTWQQHFVDHFFYDSEGKMIQDYKLTAGGQRKKYLKDLYAQYRGMIAGYDEGLVKGDAVLAAAVWRNVFDADPDVDVELLAVVTSYVRRCVAGLDKVEDDVVHAGKIKFGLPMDEEPVVRMRSKYLESVVKEKGHTLKNSSV